METTTTLHEARINALIACYRALRDSGAARKAAIAGMRAMSTEHSIDSATLAEAASQCV